MRIRLAITRNLLMPVALCFAVGGCSWDQPPVYPDPARPVPVLDEQHRLATVVTTARRQLGRPYRYGGSSPAGFDCSGLVHYAYGAAGITTPRTTAGLWRNLQSTQGRTLRPGDVLFFEVDGKPSHVGLYLGDGQFIHAPASGRSVSLAQLSDPYYRAAFVRAGRVSAETIEGR